MTIHALKPAEPSPPPLPERILELLEMLSYRRPAGSQSELDFITRYIVPTGAEPDDYGNYWLTIGSSPIMFSSHTDTVHKFGGRQHIVYGDGIATQDTKNSNCLGADCTSGVWLMLHMIRSGIPGTYVFHRAEEVGGRGSAWVRDNLAPRLAGLQYALAFDRKGYSDVITHQMDRTASDAFATSLASILRPLVFAPSSGGVFTDTQNYSDVIAECSNLSVGYFHAHQAGESQDVGFLCKLLDTLIVADWSRLTCSRDPLEYDPSDWGDYRNDFHWPDPDNRQDMLDQTPTRDRRGGYCTLHEFVENNPDAVADFLEACGHTLDDLRDFVRVL